MSNAGLGIWASIAPPNNFGESNEIEITNHFTQENVGSSVVLLTIKILSLKSETRKVDSTRAVLVSL